MDKLTQIKDQFGVLCDVATELTGINYSNLTSAANALIAMYDYRHIPEYTHSQQSHPITISNNTILLDETSGGDYMIIGGVAGDNNPNIIDGLNLGVIYIPKNATAVTLSSSNYNFEIVQVVFGRGTAFSITEFDCSDYMECVETSATVEFTHGQYDFMLVNVNMPKAMPSPSKLDIYNTLWIAFT